MIDPNAQIHPLAHVEGASVGPRTRVWQFASVIRGAKVGKDCNIASGACIDGSTIGDRCIVGHNLAMGPGFLIGDDVFIGPNVTFCNDAWPRTDKAGFDAAALMDPYRWAVIVEAGASIGANSVVLPGVRVGARAMIAAGSVVTRNVEADTLWIDRERKGPIRVRPLRMRFADEPPAVRRQRLAGDSVPLGGREDTP